MVDKETVVKAKNSVVGLMDKFIHEQCETMKYFRGEFVNLSDSLHAVVLAKDDAYRERNLCVLALAKMATKIPGWKAWLAWHEDTNWEDDWRNIVFIESEEGGQWSWHIHDSEAGLFGFLERGANTWDGHDTKEKYTRIADMPPKVPELSDEDPASTNSLTDFGRAEGDS